MLISSNDRKIVIAVTPTKDRHRFLERQLESFWEPYKNLRTKHPQIPELKWIILDESSGPSKTFQNLDDSDVTYVHIPSRADLSTVPEQFRELANACLYTEADLKNRVATLSSNTLCDRFILAHAPWIPSIGEMRNIGINIANALYGHIDPNAVIFAKDDDDYSAPEALVSIYQQMTTPHQDLAFIKFGNMLVYDAVSGTWFRYSYKMQDEPTSIMENGIKQTVPRYVVWDNKAETVENPYKHAGIYGLSFTYRLDKALELGNHKEGEIGKFGPFEPLSRREDIAFFMDIVRHFGPNQVRIMDNPDHWVTRIVHNNTTRTMHHGLAQIHNVPLSTIDHVLNLCGTKHASKQELNDNIQTLSYTPTLLELVRT